MGTCGMAGQSVSKLGWLGRASWLSRASAVATFVVVLAGTNTTALAERQLPDTLTLAPEETEQAEDASSLNELGFKYWQQGKHEQALTYFQQALALSQNQGDRRGEGESLNSIGSVYNYRGDYEQALDYYRQALAIGQEIGDALVKGDSLHNIGLIYRNWGQYEKALGYYQQSLAISREIGDSQGEGVSLNNIGALYNYLGQYQQALIYFQQALTLQKELGDRFGEGYSLNNIGFIYKQLGQDETALKHYQQSLTIRREIGDKPGEAESLHNIGSIYQVLGQSNKAMDYAQLSLTIRQAIGDRQGEGVSLHSIGMIYAGSEQFERAFAHYRQSLAIKQELGDRQGEGESLHHVAALFQAQAQPKLAILFFKESVRTYEAIRADIRQLPIEQQKSYTRTIEQTYRDLAALLLQQDRIIEAQQVLDLLKVQELKDYLKNIRSSDSRSLTILKPEQEILERYTALQKTAIEIGQELNELRQLKTQRELITTEAERLTQLLQLEQDITQQFNTFIDSAPIQSWLDQLSRNTLKQTLPLEELNALRDNLRNTNAALIYPLILEDRLELILTTPDSPPIRRTVTNLNATELKETIIAYRRALQSPSRLSETKRLAQRLYSWLIAPLEAELAAAQPETLVYAPDGVLRYIPLAALHDGELWLAERYATNNIVAQSLTEFDTAPTLNPRVLAGAWGNQSRSVKAGDKTFNFGSIPFTLSEVQSLTQFLPTEVLLEQDFSRHNLTAKDLNSFSIIHLATHGQFAAGNASNSFLALGSGEAISLPEIKDLTLTNVDLVVLSACETGVSGDFGQGEEILGLGYQFQRAGAKAALASLWQVDDGGTQELMNAFYAALKQGMTKADALQAAQQALISNDYQASGIQRKRIEGNAPTTEHTVSQGYWSHPYYWAPFILIGNGL